MLLGETKKRKDFKSLLKQYCFEYFIFLKKILLVVNRFRKIVVKKQKNTPQKIAIFKNAFIRSVKYYLFGGVLFYKISKFS